jgi:hypothetical protein
VPNYSEETKRELQGRLRERDLATGGTKDDLIARLEEDDRSRDAAAVNYPGRVERPNPDEPPRISSLVRIFDGQADRASDAIVLRGYLGRSNLLERARAYLERAKPHGSFKVNPADLEKLKTAVRDLPDGGELELNSLIEIIKIVGDLAKSQIPWRLYLSPGLDSFVDFHFSDMLAYRHEPKTEHRDASTVWLRLYADPSSGAGQVPIPYRVVHESMLGPSFAQWVGGELIDDYLGQPGSVSTAWGDQSSVFGGRPGTGVKCGVFGGGRPGTGVRCGE